MLTANLITMHATQLMVRSAECILRSLMSLCFCLAALPALAAETELKILTTEEPPTNYIVDGEVTGITTDIINDLRARLAEKTVIEIQPWARVYQTALVRPNTLIFTLGRTSERIAQGLTFIGPVTTRKHAVYKRTDAKLKVDSLDDIAQQNLLVGGIRGDWRTNLVKDHGARVDEAATHAESLKLLMHGRIDLMVLSDLELKINTDLAEVPIDRLTPAFIIAEAPAFFALSKGTSEETVRRWQQAFSDFQASDVPARLAKKWGKILGQPMEYAPDKGFFLSAR
jgi:polar amino acid transport system substrate-binding protein